MFIFLSKLFQYVFRVGNLLLLLLCLGSVLLWTKWERWGRRLVSLVCLIFLLIAVLPIGEWVMLPLENVFPIPVHLPDKVAGIITTGGVNPYTSFFTGQPALEDEAEALTTGLWLARKYPEAKLVFTGGTSSLLYQDIAEASAAALFFLQQGMDPQRLIFDEKSRGTQEKAVNCFQLLQPKASDTWILVTSAWRMPRTWLAFKQQGWNVLPYPVDFHSPNWKILKFDLDESLTTLWWGIKEWLGLIAYRVTGRTSTFLPEVSGPP